MKAILTADTHLNDDSPEELGFGIRLLDDAATLAQANGCKFVIIAGDFFHYKHKLSTKILVAVYEAFERWGRKGVRFIILRGNHDTPDTGDAEWTPLRLFAGVAVVVTTTRIVEEDDCVLALVPWFPPDRFKAEVNAAAQAVMGSKKPKILISHVSLKEGSVSPSNTRLNVPIRTADLLPGVWNRIYLGDYHAHQKFENVVYCGAPRAMTFGDYNCVGMWLMTAGGEELLPLPSRYPRFQTWRVDKRGDLPLVGYDSRDRNRIYVVNAQLANCELHYPGAKLIPITEEKASTVSNRLPDGSKMSPLAVALRWRELKKLPSEYDKELRRLLG